MWGDRTHKGSPAWPALESGYSQSQSSLKGLWHGQKWLHLFVDSEAYREQNGPNTQFKRKLRYCPMQCTYLEPSVTHVSPSTRWEINTELLVFALISRLGCWCLENPSARVHWTCSYTSLYRENVQQKYRNRVLECSFFLCQRTSVPLLQNDRGQNATASI